MRRKPCASRSARNREVTPKLGNVTHSKNSIGNSFEFPVIALLGGGNMNGAILAGLVRDDTARDGKDPVEPVRVTSRSQSSADRYADNARVTASATETNPNANRDAVRGAGVVILGVKPNQIGSLLDEIADDLEPDAVLISVAAGIEIATIEARVPEGIRVVRAMPNTPSTIGRGVTGIAGGAAADADAMVIARAVFESVGAVVEGPESVVPAVGAVAGSGPAHVYLLLERMIEAAERIGLSHEDARTATVETFRGAVEMVARSPETDVVELRRRVTSPNGTTEQSVRVLDEAGFADTFEAAFRANIARSDELAVENR